MTHKEKLRKIVKKIASSEDNSVPPIETRTDTNPLPRYGVKKEKGKTKFSTPIQPVDPELYGKERGGSKMNYYSKLRGLRGEVA